MNNKLLARTFIGLFLFLTFHASICFAQKQSKVMVEVAKNDCGLAGFQPFLIKGENYTFKNVPTLSLEAQTCNWGSTVIYAFDKLDIQAEYELEVVFYTDNECSIQISADGSSVCDPIQIPANKEVRKKFFLPRKAFAYGQLVLLFESLKGSNASVSAISIYSSNPMKLSIFSDQRKEELKHTQSYKIDSKIQIEKVLPIYAPIPTKISGISASKKILDGTWEFKARENDAWHKIQVPGQWSMQGFKVDSAAWATYRTSFEIPNDWRNKQVKVRFDGVHSEYEVFLNNKKVGYHLGGMTAYEINLTDFLSNQSNELILKVRSESLADMLGSLTQYAAHQLGGITRKVTLFALPEVHITDIRINTDLDSQYKNANLKVYATVFNSSKLNQKQLSVQVNLPTLSISKNFKVPTIKPNTQWSGWIEIPVNEPLLWDNEHPNLYKLDVELMSKEQSLEQLSKKIGFREIKIDGNRLLVNGKEVKLRGVCRHEAHPTSGRVLTTAQRWLDAKIYMEGNCNFIRTSHYPPGEEFIEACDELGLFVEMEAPICWIGHHANENWKVLNYKDPKYYNYVLQANMETMQFYRNHPSILFWSMANESYWNKEFAQVLEYMKVADPTRPSTFHDQAYGGFNNQGSTSPIANIHYPGPSGYKVAAKSERPMIYGEYCHLNVYNRSELVTDPGVRSDWALALAPTWDNMYATQGVLGGSIWSGIDDIFQLPNGNAVGYGAWGPIDGWRRPKPEYWDMKKSYSPIRVLTKELMPNNELFVEIENRYTYTNLNELTISWTYGKETGVISTNIEPGKRGIVKFDIKDINASNQLCINFNDKKGFLADAYIIPVGQQTQNNWAEIPLIKTKLSENKTSFLVKGENFFCEVNKSSGQIVSFKKNNKESICGGPWLMVLPLTGGGCYPNHNANTPIFNDICSDWKVSNVNAVQLGQNVRIEVNGSYKSYEGGYSLLINAGGELIVTYEFKTDQEVNPRQWGLVFDLPKSYDKLYWRRDGIWSVYPEGHISRSVGEASLFYEGLPEINDPRVEPTWSWNKDYNQLGSNDFRSTRRNIWYAGLKTSNAEKITVLSNGKQHWRSWLTDEKVHFLVADFVTAGDEMFLSSYYDAYRKPLKSGDVIKGKIHLQFENNAEYDK